ncbi:hypothetical protein BJ165DRAFT_1413784 [Panaeolus papilionaceus]|nr:hypothetical protein BJ165DRAFT_1413784 [Panaeolus papilionaceus]
MASGRTEHGRSSIDSDRSLGAASPPIHPNGHASTNGNDNLDDIKDPVERLQRELEFTKEEKEKLATQYRNLLAKLTQMRTSLGNKLQQDAEELDRREQLVQQLTAEKEDLNATVETLKAELIAPHEEAERASNRLDAMRAQVMQENAQETLQQGKELRATQLELERCRMERDEWERSAMQEKAISEDARSNLESLRRDLELEIDSRNRLTTELEQERERAENLQSVLHDFQSSKDHELNQAVKSLERRLLDVTQSLAEYKHRAHIAETELEESKTNMTRTQELEKEVKEKTLLIGKLRHEAVIINEHLMEALRRLRKNSADTNVDKRLVTNVILSFLNVPRGDTKRFEILQLLASILSWSEQEREKAGLQRETPTSAKGGFWGRSNSASSPSKTTELEKSDETESFSRLWVEFLLTEAASGESHGQNNNSQPAPPRNSIGSPSAASFPSIAPPKGGRRLTSFNMNAAGNASSPNLLGVGNGGPPSRKGKEKEKAPSES